MILAVAVIVSAPRRCPATEQSTPQLCGTVVVDGAHPWSDARRCSGGRFERDRRAV